MPTFFAESKPLISLCVLLEKWAGGLSVLFTRSNKPGPDYIRGRLHLASLPSSGHRSRETPCPAAAARPPPRSPGSPRTTLWFPGGFLALGLTDCLSTSAQVEYRVLCGVFSYKHTRQPSPSGNEKHTPHPKHTSLFQSSPPS